MLVLPRFCANTDIFVKLIYAVLSFYITRHKWNFNAFLLDISLTNVLHYEPITLFTIHARCICQKTHVVLNNRPVAFHNITTVTTSTGPRVAIAIGDNNIQAVMDKSSTLISCHRAKWETCLRSHRLHTNRNATLQLIRGCVCVGLRERKLFERFRKAITKMKK